MEHQLVDMVYDKKETAVDKTFFDKGGTYTNFRINKEDVNENIQKKRKTNKIY